MWGEGGGGGGQGRCVCVWGGGGQGGWSVCVWWGEERRKTIIFTLVHVVSIHVDRLTRDVGDGVKITTHSN